VYCGRDNVTEEEKGSDTGMVKEDLEKRNRPSSATSPPPQVDVQRVDGAVGHEDAEWVDDGARRGFDPKGPAGTVLDGVGHHDGEPTQRPEGEGDGECEAPGSGKASGGSPVDHTGSTTGHSGKGYVDVPGPDEECAILTSPTTDPSLPRAVPSETEMSYPQEELIEESRYARHDPVLDEWVLMAPARRSRPFQSGDSCPFCPGSPEVPEGSDVVIIPNKYPSLGPRTGGHPSLPEMPSDASTTSDYETGGTCEIVVFTSEHSGSLGTLPVDAVARVLERIGERTDELYTQEGEAIRYVFPFENRGADVGVSLSHPHGQLFALPFLPPRVVQSLHSLSRTPECHICSAIDGIVETPNHVFSSGDVHAFVPRWAHWPFEVWVTPGSHVGRLSELSHDGLMDMAKGLKTSLMGLDDLFGDEAPYIMAIHQRPSPGPVTGLGDVGDDVLQRWHLRIEILPRWRAPGLQKFLAGLEVATGTFINPSNPEENAGHLRLAIDPSTGNVTADEMVDPDEDPLE